MCLNFRRVLVSYIILIVCDLSATASPKRWQVQLTKQSLSAHNDTTYVSRIMQLAKSAEMLSYMDTNVDRCDDFYEFACGKWSLWNPASSRNNYSSNFLTLMIENYNQQLLNLLQNDGEGNEIVKPAYLKKIKLFFKSCLRLENNQIFREDLRQIINRFGNMPAISSKSVAENNTFDWLQTVASIKNTYGIDIILQFDRRRNFIGLQNVTKIFMAHPDLRKLDKTIINSQLQDLLLVPDELLNSTVNDIYEFETKLLNGLTELQNNFELRTMQYLNETYAPAIDFQKYFSIALGIHFNESIYELQPTYHKNLLKVLQTTSQNQLANYIYFQLVQKFIYTLAAFENTEREKECLIRTEEHFGAALSKLVFNYFDYKDIRHDVESMWKKLKEAFKTNLDARDFTWMSESTTDLAIEKLDAMRFEINADEKINFIENYHAINITPINTYLENLQAVLISETQTDLPQKAAKLPQYISTENIIKIPVLLLQPNFLWSNEYPEALRCATLGFLLAQEIVHGFDDVGRNFDAAGNKKTWWDAETIESYETRRKCFQHQYRRFRYRGEYLPETECQTENIASNVAIKIAYNAYSQYLMEVHAMRDSLGRAKTLKLEKLPKLDFNSRELFFLSFAQFWCEDKYSDDLANETTPAKFKVIGSLKNYDEFSKVFKCHKGSYMNPAEKCYIF